GLAYSVCGLGIDITDRHRLEVELRQARDAAEEANRAKDRFLAVLSHELRTPLTPALVAVSGLLDGTIRDNLQPTLEMVRRNIELEAHLIDDLLDISQIVRGGMRLDRELLDAHEVLHQSLEVCRSETERAALQIELDLSPSRSWVRVDRARLLQLFWNLIHNAVKFSLDGGRLAISSRVDRDPSGDEPGWLHLEFSDSGMGLSPEALEKVFQPFEQAWSFGRARQGGLGLGLAISRSIAEVHGGRLTVSSPGLNLGTRFLLELPLARGADMSAPSRSRRRIEAETDTPDEPPAGPLRILLVEDNADTLRYLDLVLSHMGHQVRSASTVSAALDTAAEHAFDLVLSDIELPDGTGLELMRTIASNRATPGIAMSGFGSEEDTRLSLSAGFSLHLTKPLDTSRLEQAIRQVTRMPTTSDCSTAPH
ncbi:MAG TPA: ATP-binding protein, partial [Isosphaeraceae bacterium]|nr:ATP-binding protein [Isosphaeraceae bacterium]